MALLSKQDRGRSRVAGFTREISGLCSFWLEWLVKVGEKLNPRLGGATRSRKVESGLMSNSEFSGGSPHLC
jgi:hypothetical protein